MDFYVMSQNKKIYDYPPHSHEMWEVLLNLTGNGIATINDEIFDFHPGTIFCIRPGIEHCKKSDKGFVDGCILIRDFCFDSEPEDVLVFEDDERHSIESLFRVAYGYPVNPGTDIYGERFLRSVVDAIQNLLSHWKQSELKNPEILKVQKILSDHVADKQFDINRVIQQTSYSLNHFRKIFKDQCGCTLLQYYQKLKIQMAKQLILQNKSFMTMGEIAHECGFEDPYYFSRVFKKVEGVSPMKFYYDSSHIVPREMQDDI